MTPHHSLRAGAGQALDLPALARTALYREAWGGRVPGGVADAPPLSLWQWRRHVHAGAGRSLIAEPALWVLYPTPGDDPIWIPFAPEDLEAGASAAAQTLATAGMRAGDVVLAVAPPAPWAGNMLPYLLSSADRLARALPPTGAQVFPLSVATVGYKPDLAVFPLSRDPTVIAGTKADIADLTEHLRRGDLKLPRFRLALLTGPPLSAGDPELADETAYLLYVPGLFAPVGGAPGRRGVWLPSDTITAELIHDDEWGRTVQDPSRVPTIRMLAESNGDSGELVITVHNAALPLVRLRTAIRVRAAQVNDAGVWLDVLSRAAGRTAETTEAFTPANRR